MDAENFANFQHFSVNSGVQKATMDSIVCDRRDSLATGICYTVSAVKWNRPGNPMLDI